MMAFPFSFARTSPPLEEQGEIEKCRHNFAQIMKGAKLSENECSEILERPYRKMNDWRSGGGIFPQRYFGR